MSSYIELTTARTTIPDQVALFTAVKNATGDPTAVLVSVWRTWRGKKSTPWTPAQIAAVQTLLDTTPECTPRLAAQRIIDAWPIEYKALVLALIDQLNVIRAALPTPLVVITPAQAIAAIRTKAGTL